MTHTRSGAGNAFSMVSTALCLFTTMRIQIPLNNAYIIFNGNIVKVNINQDI